MLPEPTIALQEQKSESTTAFTDWAPLGEQPHGDDSPVSQFFQLGIKGQYRRASYWRTVVAYFQRNLQHYHHSSGGRLKWTVSRSVMSDSLQLQSPPGSSIHGIIQARILEWVTIPFSRGSSWPRGQPRVSCIAGRLVSGFLLKLALRRLGATDRSKGPATKQCPWLLQPWQEHWVAAPSGLWHAGSVNVEKQWQRQPCDFSCDWRNEAAVHLRDLCL